MRREGNLLYCWWECKLVQPLWRTVRRVLKKLPSNCTTRYLPKGYKNTDSKGYMHPDVYNSIINNSQIIERAQCKLTDEWIKKIS